MSAHQALRHTWICPEITNPLNSALEQGDLPLSQLPATHDRRYNQAWKGSLSPEISQIVLRVAAANGHYELVRLAVQGMPKEYDFSYRIPRWSAKPALVRLQQLEALK